jgi:ligand-binding sensor domain-containing protein
LPLGVILGGLATVIIVALFAGVVLPRLGQGRRAANATATAAGLAATTAPAATLPAPAPTSAAQPATEPAAGPEVEPSPSNWQSWTAANRARRLLIHGDELYAAGPGGITVWSVSEGTVLRRYTTGDGLPHPNVFSVWVDEDGTLWAATEAGLGRLNPGADEWITYDSADGLDSDIVTSIVRAGEFLVIASQYSGQDGGGLNLFDGQKWGPAPGFPSTNWEQALAQGKLANNVNVLLADGNRLWVGTVLGLGRYENDSQTWTRYTTDEGLPSNSIFSLYVDHDGTLLVGTEAGAARFDGSAFQKIDQGPPYGVYGIVQDADNRYYFSGGGGIWRYDPANVNWEEFSNQTGDLSVYNLTDAVAAEDGTLFFGSDGVGPIRFNGQAFTPWYIDDSTVVAGHDHILPAPDLGQLWFVELYGAYADRFDLQNQAWLAWIENPCDCLPLAIDAAGNQWGSRWQQGFVILFPEGTLSEVGAEAGLPAERNVRVIVPLPDGTAWIGTDEDGLAFYDGERVEFVDEAEGGPPRARVWSLFLASDGTLWAGVGEQISRRAPDGTWEHFQRGADLDGNFEYAADFAEDEDGGIWVATNAAGVYLYQDETWTQFVDGQAGVQLPSNYVHAVALAPDGSLWFGTTDGAANFDGSDWTTYQVRDGLINAEVFDVYVEPDGVVWFATAGGVTRLRP